MKRQTFLPGNFRLVCTALYALLLAAVLPAAALDVWTGPLMTFTKTNGSDSLQPINQDRITPNVWLTRNTTRGLYNIAAEDAYISYYSPQDTEWAYGNLADYNSLTYSEWQTWNSANPPSSVGQDAVLHLISDDIYMFIRFTSWGASAGGFSYERSTPAVPEPSVAATFLMGLFLTVTARFRRCGIGR